MSDFDAAVRLAELLIREGYGKVTVNLVIILTGPVIAYIAAHLVLPWIHIFSFLGISVSVFGFLRMIVTYLGELLRRAGKSYASRPDR